MTVSEVGRMAIFFSRGLSPACVTHATSAAKPSIWDFSFSRTSCETNNGKATLSTPMLFIFLLNHACISSHIKYAPGLEVSAYSNGRGQLGTHTRRI